MVNINSEHTPRATHQFLMLVASLEAASADDRLHQYSRPHCYQSVDEDAAVL